MQVEAFIGGSQKLKLDNVHAEIVESSYILRATIPAVLMAAIFDILTKPRVAISPKEEKAVKKVARGHAGDAEGQSPGPMNCWGGFRRCPDVPFATASG